MTDALTAAVDEARLVETAVDLVSIASPTGSEQEIGEYLHGCFRDLGLRATWQEIEDGRPNVLGVLEGTGGGTRLMFNGHIDTSYSGKEPWLAGIPGFQPRGFVDDGHIYGLGISNMKGAIACYIEAVRALQDAGVRLQGDVMIAAVAGEIEKTQWGEFGGREFRGYGAGSTYLVTHGGIADVCILGEPTEQKIVPAHFGAVWMRLSTHGPFIHTAFSEGRRGENSIVRMRDVLDAVLEWAPGWEEQTAYRGARGIVNIGCVDGGFPWRASRTPQRTDLFLDVRIPPSMSLPTAENELAAFARALRDRFPTYGVEWEFYVTVPGASIPDDHLLIQTLDKAHAGVFGSAPEREILRWTADSSVLVGHGIPTVNYGVSSGLPSADRGENLEIAALVDTARVYALAASSICSAT